VPTPPPLDKAMAFVLLYSRIVVLVQMFGARDCMSLSASLFCDSCGAANRAEAQFCRVCGQPLHAHIHTLSNTLTGLLTLQTMLKGRYTVLKQAGRGGFGAVYKAADTQFGNRLVAIKEMSQNSLDARDLAAATEAFKNEAMLLAGLTHPNLPRIYEQFAENGRSYLVMDFIDGETLEDHIKNADQKKVAVDKVLEIALQLCSVLEYLHTRQPPIIFRDLKPGNVMLTSNGHIYLIDFGIARHFKPGQKQDTTALGSSGYAPPEQYGKSQTTERADIYSLSATLHQLLSGNDPSESPFRFAPLHFTEPALAGLDTLIMSMVSIEINKRPASITSVRQELQRIATQYMVHNTHPLPQTLSSPLSPVGKHIPNPYQPPQGLPLDQSAQGAPVQGQQTTKKKPVRPSGPPQVYPQANTLYICMGHASRVTAVAWSPDGKHLASASYDKTVQVWGATKGNHVLTYKGHAGRVNGLSWSPDGKCIASVSDDRTVQIWEPTSGKTIFTYHGHNAPLHVVSWSPDGAYIASAGEDKTIQIWQANTHQALSSHFEHKDTIQTLAWSPDSKYLASAGKDAVVKIWEPLKTQQKRSLLSTFLFPQMGQKTLGGYGGPIHALAWSPDNRRIATVCADYRIGVRDVVTGLTIFSQYSNSSTMKNTVAWSPNGKHLAIGGNDKVVRLWNVFNKKESFAYHGHTGYVTSVAWSPDGARIASAGVDRTVQVWQAV